MLYEGLLPEIQITENELGVNESLFKTERCPKSEDQISEITIHPDQSKHELNRKVQRLRGNKVLSVPDRWAQSYVVGDTYDPRWLNFERHKQVDSKVIEKEVASLTEVPSELPAFQAVCWAMGSHGVDMRPHLYDKKLGQFLLLDSGAQISACPPEPGDKVDPSMTLRAANGSKMNCYGTKTIKVQIGRKEYEINAIKTDVENPILGWNFVKKHKLGFEWNEWGDICIIDKKADISASLKYKALPTGKSGLATLSINGQSEDSDSQGTQFELACMQALTEETEQIDNDLSKLPDDQYKALLEKFPDLLKLHFEEEFTKNGVQHRILTGDAKPSKAKKRNMLPGSPREVAAKKAFSKLIDLGIVEPVNSTDPNNWVSPIHFVPKPGGGLRPVGDYRDLNSKTELDQYPLPNVRAFTHEIRGARYFSKVDLCKAFHQILIDKRDRWKTCVATPWGLFNFKRLSMGLKNSGQSFQRLIENVLQGLPQTFVYLDDILVYTESEEEHLRILEELFNRLQKAGLTISLSKCEFGKTSLDYLGYTVSKQGVRPIEKKIEAISNYPIPEKQKQLLAFLGALNYYRASLPNLPPDKNYGYARTPAEVLAPLYHLATAEIKPSEFKKVWDGNPIAIAAFNDAKQLLQRAVTLNHPDPRAPIALSTDASKFALGASIDQLVDGVWKPLGFWSRALKPTQQNYSTYRRELMAIMYSMRHFNDLFNGRHLTVFCDHAPIIGTFKSQELQSHDPIALNAIREIGMFTSDIRHKAGKDLIVPDWLSRPAGCPIGRAYELEKEDDFDTDKYQFTMPVKGKIQPDSIVSKAPSSGQSASIVSEKEHSRVVSAINSPGGETVQPSAPPIDDSKLRAAPSAGLDFQGDKPPTYVPPETTLAALEQVALQILSPEAIQNEQQTCPDVLAHKKGDMPKNVVMGMVDMLGASLYCEISNPDNPRPLIAKKHRSIVANLLHHADHPNIDETVRRISLDYYWPGLRTDIKNFVRSCHPCQVAKQSKTVNPGVGSFQVPDSRFSVIHLDIVGPLPKSHDGYKSLLTCLDRTSRWFEAYPIKQDSAMEVAEAFMQWVARFGVCDRAVSDNGNAFVSRLFQDIMRNFNIEVAFTPAYHAATNGAIERQHQTMKNALKAALIDMGNTHRDQWTRALPWVLLGKRVQYQPFLDASSSQLVLGKSLKMPGQLLKEPGPPLNTVEIRALLDQLYKLHDRPGIQMSTKTDFVDISHTNNATHVYLKVDNPQSLCPRFEGPYRIHSRPSRSTIEVILGRKKNGDLRLSTYHWSSAKVAHLRDGAVDAERPKLGRPVKAVDKGLSSNTTSELKTQRNSSVKSPTSVLGEGAGHTDGQSRDTQPPANVLIANQPITATEKSHARNRPITGASASTSSKPAKIQTESTDTLTGRQPHPNYVKKGPVITDEMFQKWTPDLLGLPDRPVRTTRNKSPKYVDAIWSATPDEVAALNEHLNSLRR